MKNLIYLLVPLFLFSCDPEVKEIEQTVIPSSTKKGPELMPDQLYGQLFKDVQMQQVFPDGKTFVDCTPKAYPSVILLDYEKQKEKENFDLKKFVLDHFELPKKYATGFKADNNRSVEEHINSLWPVLTRQKDANSDNQLQGSLMPLPNPYIVPGGRFGEIYYWDSYFTMLGLQTSGKIDMIENMVKNFAHLIDRNGFIPNGNRTYFLTRSQPPFFGKMVGLLAESKGNEVITAFLPQLEKEYNFWMNGQKGIGRAKSVHQKVVRLNDGEILNRYWDKGVTPRAESYREDVETMKKSGRDAKVIYQDIRSACESGWDFSSRWFKDQKTLETIITGDIIPVDLNCLLYDLEKIIAKGHEINGNEAQRKKYEDHAVHRKDAILKYCWNEQKGFFMDYNLKTKQHTPVMSLAGVFPLESNIATAAQAKRAAAVIKSDFLKAGGVVSTNNNTGQQWDYPNGWAPLQWMTYAGLKNYKQDDLANDLKNRWIALNKKVYKNTGKMVEKYNVVDMSLDAGGGEYPVQDGFGWTNGVLLKMLSESKVNHE